MMAMMIRSCCGKGETTQLHILRKAFQMRGTFMNLIYAVSSIRNVEFIAHQ
jgi:hypothetical protein